MDGPTGTRARLIRRVADLVPPARGPACVRVGVDGPDGSGKTMFADELAGVLRATGRPVVRVSADDFHNVRAIRYRRGRESSEGFWLDSYDYPRLRADVLDPLGPGGDRRYRPVAHDVITDEVLTPPWESAAAESVLVLDGLFLHRAELADVWDLTVFLDVPFAETARRMAERDGTDTDPEHPTMRRYVQAQRRYFRSDRPHDRATVVIDNTAIEEPRVTKWPDMVFIGS